MTEKLITVKIRPEAPLSWSGETIEEWDDRKFLDYARGEIALSVFNGELDNILYRIVSMSYDRGKLQYHRDLLESVKKK